MDVLYLPRHDGGSFDGKSSWLTRLLFQKELGTRHMNGRSNYPTVLLCLLANIA